MTKPLEKEFQWYLANQDDLVKKYNGRMIVIKGTSVLGDYADISEAVAETSKTEKPGTFLVQKCEPGTDSYTQTYPSRVIFA